MSDWRKKIDHISYSFLGSIFRKRENTFSELIKAMNQARYSIDYDLYLSRITFYSIIYAIIGFFVGILLSGLLTVTGLIFVAVLPVEVPGFLAGVFERYRVGLMTLMISLILSVITFFSAFGILYYIPFFKASERGRMLDQNIPPSVTYMYALSKGGMNIVDVFKTMAESDDVYGEVAKEFDMIIKDMEYLGSDIQEAIINASETTPSMNMSDFFDDLVGLIDSGGEIDDFLLTKSEQYHEVRKQNQKEFLETLGVLSEAYVTLLVAAPLFVIVITSILTLLGGGGMFTLYLIIYIIMPLATFGFIIVVDMISTSQDDTSMKIYIPDYKKLETTVEEIESKKEKSKHKNKFDRLIQAKKRYKYVDFINNPFEFTIENPIYTLLFTVPLTLLYLILILVTGAVTISLDALISDSWYTTTLLFVIPIYLLIFPFAIFSGIKNKRRNRIKSQLSDGLKKLSNANEAGMSLEQGLRLVGQTSTGSLAKEFDKVATISQWNTDIKVAMTRMANRLKIPRLSRTVKLITKAKDSSGDIKEVLGIAARDAETAKNFERERKQNMLIYSMIIILSFVIFLGVLIILQSFFLQRMANIETGGEASQKLGSIGFNPSDVPVDRYRMVFYHAALIQGFGSGLMAGKMAKGKAINGLKWSLAMATIAVFVFILV